MRKHKNTDSGCRFISSQGGFSLLELTIVMLVASIFVAPMYFALKKSMNAGVNADRPTMIRSGLAEYFRINGKYPCPADITAAYGDADYMLESCGTAISTPGATAGNVLIGAVPVQTLAIFMDCSANYDPANPAAGLAADGLTAQIYERFRSQIKNMVGIYRESRTGATGADILNTGVDKTACIEVSNMYTDYDTKYIYAVTQSATNMNTFDRNDGQIRILDVNGNPATEKNQIFVIVDTGLDRKGARNIDGALTGIACGAAAGGEDFENCDNDSTFVTGLFSDTVGANHYDDKIDYGLDDLMREDEMWSFEGADPNNPNLSVLPAVAANARVILGKAPDGGTADQTITTDDKLIINEGNVRLGAGNLTATDDVNAEEEVRATGFVRGKSRVESKTFCYDAGSSC